MIFDSQEIGRLLAGRKTLVAFPRFRSPKLAVGQTYPVQEVRREVRERAPSIRDEDRRWREETIEHRETRCYVKVTARFECDLRELADEQVEALGFQDRGDLFAWWRGRYEGVENPSRAEPAVEIPVVVAAIVLTEPVRYPVPAGDVIDPLSPNASDPRGYTHGGRSLGAGAAVDADFQERLSNGELPSPSQRQYDLDRARERAAHRNRPLHEQVRELEEAQQLGHDVSRQLAGIRRRVEAGQRKLGRDAA